MSKHERLAEEMATNAQREVLPLNTELHLLLRPQAIAIHTPGRIPSHALRPFLDRSMDVLCVGDDAHLIPATLVSVGERALSLQVTDHRYIEECLQWQGRRIVVLFPAGPRLQYVLEVCVQKVTADELVVSYIDPRSEQRFEFVQNTPVELRFVSPALALQILSGHVDIVRQTDGLAATDDMTESKHIEEQVYPTSEPSDSPDLKNLPNLIECETKDVVNAVASDISVGGMKLMIDGRLAYQHGEGALMYASMVYPITATSQESRVSSLSVKVLSVVRRTAFTGMQSQLHIRFVHRLPDSCDAYFAALQEGSRAAQVRPAA